MPQVFRLQGNSTASGAAIALRGANHNNDSLRPLVAKNDAATGVKVDEALYATINESSSLPFRAELSRGALGLWSRVTSLRDMLTLFIGVHVAHVQITTKFVSYDTTYDACASFSWLALSYVTCHLTIVCASNVARTITELSQLTEVALDIWGMVLGFVLAAASSSQRWQLQQGADDVCSSATNPTAAFVYLLADIAGIGGLLRLLLLTYALPPVGPGWVWLILLSVVAAVVQLSVLDTYAVPEVAKIWKNIEKNGSGFDADLAEVTDRLSSLESLFNTTR